VTLEEFGAAGLDKQEKIEEVSWPVGTVSQNAAYIDFGWTAWLSTQRFGMKHCQRRRASGPETRAMQHYRATARLNTDHRGSKMYGAAAICSK